MKMELYMRESQQDSEYLSMLAKKIWSEFRCQADVDYMRGVIVVTDVFPDRVGYLKKELTMKYNPKRITLMSDTTVTAYGKMQDEERVLRVKFADYDIEKEVVKLINSVQIALKNNSLTPKEIQNFLRTVRSEIAMRSNPKELLPVQLGDIVECNFGFHAPGELYGAFVHAIVCNIDSDEMLHVVPITKLKYPFTEKLYFPFEAEHDVIYQSDKFKGGTALLRLSTRISPHRVNGIVGYCLEEFFHDLLTVLPTAWDFFEDNADAVNEVDDDVLDFEEFDDIDNH